MRKEGDARAMGLPLLWPTERERASKKQRQAAHEFLFFLLHQNRFVLLSNVYVCVCTCVAVAGTCLGAHTGTTFCALSMRVCHRAGLGRAETVVRHGGA